MKRGSLEVLKCEGGAHPRLWCNLITVPEVEAWDTGRLRGTPQASMTWFRLEF